MKTAVQMKINQENLVKTLRLSFSNKDTFLGELLQNSRRAGARFVDITFHGGVLTVKDDGCGVGDFQKLLTVAESGWDLETVEREHPFGIGFLSALYACKRIAVTSGGLALAAETADILSFKPVALAAARRSAGTVIAMEGVGLGVDGVRTQLTDLAKGFPIPVAFNGQGLPRPHALTGDLPFVATEAGEMSLSGLNAEGKGWPVTTRFVCYLQGLPIYRSPSYDYSGDRANVIHLDSKVFHARLPDRDKLIDESAAISGIRDTLRREAMAQLKRVKESLPPEAFAEGYETITLWQGVELLNDVDVLPRHVLRIIADYPCIDNGENYFLEMPKNHATRHDIQAGTLRIAVISEDVDGESGALPWMFAWKKDISIFQGNLDKDHWLHPLAQDLDQAMPDVSLEFVGETHRAYFDGEWVSGTAVFCDAYRIRLGQDSVEITDSALYDKLDGVFAVPFKDPSGLVVGQASGYRDDDQYQESTYLGDVDLFNKFAVANTSKDPAEALKRLLPPLQNCPQLYGRRFVVTIGEGGSVVDISIAA